MKSPENAPKTAADFYEQATLYLSQQQFQQATLACQEAIKLQPDFSEAYKTLGVIMQLHRKYEVAQQLYKQALQFNPSFAEVYANLGSLYAEQKNWEAAIASYQKAIDLKPDLAGLYRNIARIFDRIDQPKKSLDYWCQFVILEPNQIKLKEYIGLGDYLVENDQIERAIALYKKAIEVNPHWAEIYYKLGEIYNKNKEIQASIHQFRKAVQLKPDVAYFHSTLAKFLQDQEQLYEAIEHYKKAIELNTKDFSVYTQLGDIYIQIEQPQEAISLYRQALQMNSQAAWLYNKLGNTLFEQKQIEEAITAYRQSIILNPNLPWSYFRLAEALFENKQFDEAIIAYYQTSVLDPHLKWLLHIRLEELFQVTENLDQALDFYQKLRDRFPKTACYYYYFLAKSLSKNQDYEQALFYCLKSLQIKPDYMAAYKHISFIFEQQGRLQEAQACRNLKELPLNLIKKYFQLPQNYTTNSDLYPQITHIPIYPACNINLQPPQTIKSELNPVFKFNKYSLRSAFVAKIPNGKVWGDLATSIVMTPDNKIVADLSTGCGELILTSDILTFDQEIDGTIAFLTVRWGEAYYHWMLDILPMFHLIQSSNIPLENIDYFVINSCRFPYQSETLNILGIPPEKIIESLKVNYITAKNIIVPSSSIIFNKTLIPKWACDFLKQRFLVDSHHQSFNKKAKIYISREKADVRRIINEDEIIQVLDKFGFQKVILESLSVAEQANLMARAEVVIASHGAGLTNLVFCQPRTKVIELFTPNYVPPNYYFISNICNLDYYYLIGQHPESTEATDNRSTDIWINPHELLEMLKIAAINRD